jgi:hypothetical protein
MDFQAQLSARRRKAEDDETEARRSAAQEISERAEADPDFKYYSERISYLDMLRRKANQSSKDRISNTQKTIDNLMAILDRDYISNTDNETAVPMINSPRANSLLSSITQLKNKIFKEEIYAERNNAYRLRKMNPLLEVRSNVVLRIERNFESAERAKRIREANELEERKEAIRRQQRIESKNLSVRSRIERSNRIKTENSANQRRYEEDRSRYLKEREITGIRRRPSELELYEERVRNYEEDSIEGRMRSSRHHHYSRNIPEGFFQSPTLNDYGTAGRCCMMQEESKETHPKFHLPRFIADNVFEWSKQVIISCNAQLPMASTAHSYALISFIKARKRSS